MSEAMQYLSFSVAGEDYAVDILRVQEIRGVCPITPLPQAPRHVRGVMNLRGAVVPVMELRVALGLPSIDYGKYAVIVVLSVHERTVGLLVDGVSDVLAVATDAIERPPEIAGRSDTRLVSGIARAAERFVMLLDIEQILGRRATGEAA